MKRILVILVLVPSVAHGDVVAEFMAGQSYSALDMNFSGDLTENTGLVFRSVNRFVYSPAEGEDRVRPYAYSDMVMKFPWNLGGLVGVEFSPLLSLVPHLGLQYQQSWMSFSLYAYAFCTLKEKPEGKGGVVVSYLYGLNEGGHLFLQLETFSSVGWGEYFSSENLRMGLRLGSFTGGFAANIEQSWGSSFAHGENYGFFVSKRF